MSYRLGGAVGILGIVLLVVLQGSLNAAENETVLSPVKAYEVTSAHEALERSFPGKVVASSSANLATKVGGQVKAIYFQPGDLVKKGSVLLEIDPTDYELGYEQAQANLSLAQSTYSRISASHAKGVSTQSDLDNVRANLDLANIGLKQAKNSLADTKLIAPYDGIVVRVMPEQYEFITPTQPLIFFQSQQAILIDFQVPSDIVSRFRSISQVSGSLINVRFDALPNVTFEAKLKEFSAESDSATRAYDATLTMPLPAENVVSLLPGMDATVELRLGDVNPSSAVLVPSHAVFLHADQPSVWRIVGDHVERTAVTLGTLRNDGIEVESGLNPGDKIVTAGIHQLTDQQVVTVWKGK
jgi:RND family efflux transporter MFP subunit